MADKYSPLTSIRYWIQQPTTLSGLSLFIAGSVGIWTGSIGEHMGGTMMAASLPLLLPDNTAMRRIGQVALPPLISALAKHGSSQGHQEQHHDVIDNGDKEKENNHL